MPDMETARKQEMPRLLKSFIATIVIVALFILAVIFAGIAEELFHLQFGRDFTPIEMTWAGLIFCLAFLLKWIRRFDLACFLFTFLFFEAFSLFFIRNGLQDKSLDSFREINPYFTEAWIAGMALGYIATPIRTKRTNPQ